LAELCSQLLFKGRKVYVEGRLQTRSWTGQDGSQRQTTEVVIEEMIILDNRQAEQAGVEAEIPNEPVIANKPTETIESSDENKTENANKEESSVDTDINAADIPF
jgi:single-strand DNA-binding protein